MYKLIGGDQKEYGPVTAEQVKQWIVEGRASAQTKIQSEASGEWKPLSEFPEFVEALAQKSAPPPGGVPPKQGAADSGAMAAEFIARGFRFDLAGYFSRSWQLFKDHFWQVIVATILVAVLGVLSTIISFIPFIGPLIGCAVDFILGAGYSLIFLKLARGQKAGVEEAFEGVKKSIVPLLLGGIVSSVLTLIGFLLLILPGIYLVVAWSFAPLLIIDKRLDFWPALELSRKVVTKVWFQIFAMFLVCFGIFILGALALGVGLLVAFPLIAGAWVYIYEEIFGSPEPAKASL